MSAAPKVARRRVCRAGRGGDVAPRSRHACASRHECPLSALARAPRRKAAPAATAKTPKRRPSGATGGRGECRAVMTRSSSIGVSPEDVLKDCAVGGRAARRPGASGGRGAWRGKGGAERPPMHAWRRLAPVQPGGTRLRSAGVRAAGRSRAVHRPRAANPHCLCATYRSASAAERTAETQRMWRASQSAGSGLRSEVHPATQGARNAPRQVSGRKTLGGLKQIIRRHACWSLAGGIPEARALEDRCCPGRKTQKPGRSPPQDAQRTCRWALDCPALRRSCSCSRGALAARAMRRAAPFQLRAAACAALAALAVAAGPVPLRYDAPLPTVVRVCVEIYPPFVVLRVRCVARMQTTSDLC